MIKINNAEEKKMIIAYIKMCSNKAMWNLLCNSSIHAAWFVRWREDFMVNGKCLTMWHQKFVVSANKCRKGIEPPQYYNEYNEFINSVTDWINDNYDLKTSRKVNRRKFVDILLAYREKCVDELGQLLKGSESLSDCILSYKFLEQKCKGFSELANYSIVYNGTILFRGSYEETKDYIINTDKLISEKVQRNLTADVHCNI